MKATAALAFSAVAGVLAAGCSDRNNGTLLAVVVSSDLRVPDQLSVVLLEVFDVTAAGGVGPSRLSQHIPVGEGGRALPLTVGLVPGGKPPDSELEVRVSGDRTAIIQAARVHFVPGQARTFDLALEQACLAKTDCPADQTCRQGACDMLAVVTRPYGSPAGAGGDAADAGGDAAPDAPVPPDGSMFDGAPPPAGTWTPMSPVVGNTDFVFNAVWVAAPGDVWVAGRAGASAGIIRHLASDRWSAAALPPAVPPLYGLWGSGAEAWAVGSFGTILHWDGMTWSAVADSGTQENLVAVWGGAPGDVTAVGNNGVIVHKGLQGWSAASNPGKGSLNAITGSVPGDAWAVGTANTILRRINGAWTLRPPPPAVAGVFHAVWASLTSVWALGTVTIHGAADTWDPAPVYGAPPLTRGVWGPRDGDLWAVGQNEASPQPGPAVSHFDGAVWVAVPVPGAIAPLLAVHGAGGEVWVAGNDGQVLRFRPAP